MKRVLLVAFHYPPTRGSSGIQRTLRFAKYLSAFGWDPIVLTANRSAYPRTEAETSEIAPDVPVSRALALDAKRHLSIGDWYPVLFALPDRWKSWWLSAVPVGLAMIRRYAPRAIWSTYPIATAHSIASTLHRLTELPWVADFRDPMAQDGYPRDPRLWASYKAVEENAVAHAAKLVFTTPGARALYRDRYASTPAERFCIIENGYDEESFPVASDTARSPLNTGRVTLLHSGIVYPSERDPSRLIEALKLLQSRGVVDETNFRIRFRAPAYGELLRSLADKAGVASLLEIVPSVSYQAAIDEMLRADALLLLQAANCNQQIPAKLYEYLRCGRPILPLTDPAGDTAQTLRNAGCDRMARLDDAEDIAALLTEFIRAPQRDTFNLPLEQAVAGHSRRSRTGELAALLDQVTH